MSEITTQNVFEIEAGTLDGSPSDHKAILAMQATGLYIAGDSRFTDANARLIDAAHDIGAPPTMTYRDLVFTSPVEAGANIPVLSDDPAVASNEARFYVAHRRIEGNLYGAIESLTSSTDGASAATQKVAVAAAEMGRLHTSLTAEDFGVFRPLFAGINGYPGPSGQYSESIPILDLLIHGGSNIKSEERERMLGNIAEGLYPDYENHTAVLEQLLHSAEPQLDMPLPERSGLIKQLNNMRRIHRGSVKKLVPEVYDNGAEGTGGTANVPSYLASKVITAGASHD